MVNIKTLLPELKKLVTELAEDLLARSTEQAEIDTGLREAYGQIEKGGRIAAAFEVWRDDYLDQVAVAWVLSCVFVRFMEDNDLIDECWLAGEGDRRKQAEDAHELYFRQHPRESDREYFEHVFHEVGKIPACRDLLAEGKTPLWALGPSGDAVMKLLAFWREIDTDAGHLKRPFDVEDGDTRFLGDLYQELSERAKKKFALLQTPVFVEEFILDRTLTPALDEFGLIHKTNDQGQLTNDSFRMIDPTCGSGHFLLGGFARLFDLWSKPDHTTDNAEIDAQKALDGVWGVDINPFAVAIARFRLIVAALQACGIKQLKRAPGWNIHVATGDSLLLGRRWDRSGETVKEQGWLGTDEECWAPEIYACEDKSAIQEVLCQQYHVVVGNPPYITPKDRASNNEYRRRYMTAYDKYHLSTPFTERFFELSLSPTERQGAGFIGAITDNAFMKRDYGIKLVQDFFPKIDLTHVVDTSGAYIPGHGTPTVIIFGRNRTPTTDTIRAVLGITGEPATPADASKGFVWGSILKHIDTAGAEDAYTSAADVSRATFASHPWSIGGGGASELAESIDENASQTLSQLAGSIGITSFTLEDDVYILPSEVARRRKINPNEIREMVVGDMLRDWSGSRCAPAIFPYESTSFRPFNEDYGLPLFRFLWSYRTNLANSKMFGGKTKVQTGLRWYEYGRLTHNKLRTPLSITFAFVATHNHFVLDRGGKVFKQSAPIIKLPAEATEDDHLALLGLLNSSTACFWMKQTFHNKGSTVDQHGARQRTSPFEDFYEYTGTGLQRFPVPESRPVDLARRLDGLARQSMARLPEEFTHTATPTPELISLSRSEEASIQSQMIALQEELDWQCYQLYGLTDEALVFETQRHREHGGGGEGLGASSVSSVPLCLSPPPIQIGERAFEILMARQMANGELKTTWFERHGSTPITEIPTHWPAAYRKLVERRIKLIETNKEIALIEKPEYKRRWNTEPWEEQERRALKNWLLDRLETPKYRKGTKDNPEQTTTAQMADVASADAEFLQVAAIYRGRPDFDFAALVAELVEGESVPFLPVLRYKPAGLRKRAVWERTWDLQREEDRHLSLVTGHLSLVTGHSSLVTGHSSLVTGHSSLANDKGQMTNDKGPMTNDKGPMTNDKGPMSIPVPPKYTSADFLKSDYWRLRGKLDVPKERWISFPHCETESDPSLVVGWAGWDHLQQATAIVAYYDARKREGWTAERLKPLLAALDQLLPWIHQWHGEIDPEYNETAGTSFQTLLESEAQELGLTLDDIRNWTPPKKTAKKGGRKKAKG